MTPEVPSGTTLQYGSPDYVEMEDVGSDNAHTMAFVLVAGGLGERLGYGGIKIALPAEITTGKCYLNLYIDSILAIQRIASVSPRAPCTLPAIGCGAPVPVPGCIATWRFQRTHGLSSYTLFLGAGKRRQGRDVAAGHHDIRRHPRSHRCAAQGQHQLWNGAGSDHADEAGEGRQPPQQQGNAPIPAWLAAWLRIDGMGAAMGCATSVCVCARADEGWIAASRSPPTYLPTTNF